MTDFHRLIVDWYRQNKRDLPWRNTINPYKIWLSETILQQTRVEQGLSYYYKFIEHFPTINDLACTNEETILNLWQGLGYYSRARNLHNTAKSIVDQFNGNFPSTYESLIQLKGIGPYTAAAIASFSFNECKAVVDGNVYRVLSRIFNISTPIDSTEGKKVFQELASELIPANNPAEHNQAIMEFGALHCTPKKPKCENCPFIIQCEALKNKTIETLPVKTKKIKPRDRFLHFIIFLNQNQTIIEKRVNDKDIWKHLYQFPLIETDSIETPLDLENDLYYKKIGKLYTHILSHQKLNTQFYISHQFPTQLNENQQLIQFSNIQDYPLPRLIDRFLEENYSLL